jgi:hypothetical protein
MPFVNENIRGEIQGCGSNSSKQIAPSGITLHSLNWSGNI